MNTTDPGQLFPGSTYEVTKLDATFHIRPTQALEVRNRVSFRGAVILIVLLFAPLASVAALFGEKMWSLRAVEVAGSLIALAAIWMAIRKPPARHPLVINPDGQIEYRGRLIRPAGRVATVRAFREDLGGDSGATYHVECIAADSGAVELPRRFFKGCEPKEIAAVVPLLGHVLGASVRDELENFSPAGYTRKRSPAQGGHTSRKPDASGT
ncbi:MAG TPA: hypothetical protein VF345_06600 [Chthoniobacterales bacterium]